MRPAFLDTSFLFALLRRRDAHRAAAVAMPPRFRGPLVTTEHVLVEPADRLPKPVSRGALPRTIAVLRTNPRIRIVPASTELPERALSLLASRPDKAWGLTGWTSFCFMKEESLTGALTGDRRFEQAGFKALLRE